MNEIDFSMKLNLKSKMCSRPKDSRRSEKFKICNLLSRKKKMTRSKRNKKNVKPLGLSLRKMNERKR